MSAEAIMGAAALASIPDLSMSEAAIGGEAAAGLQDDVREFAEDWLYFHLVAARVARVSMDRLAVWGPDYVYHYRAREQALAAASTHYRRLLRHGCSIPELLARMALAEELTP